MGADDDKDAAPPATGLKMSMTMTSRPKKALGATAAGFAAASELRDAEAKKESVEEVVEGNIGKDNEPVIIPGAGNTFHLGGAQHLRPGALTGEEAEEAEMLQAEAGMSLTDESAGAPAARTGAAAPAAAPLDEEAEAAQALIAEVRKSGGAGIFGNNGKVDEAELTLTPITLTLTPNPNSNPNPNPNPNNGKVDEAEMYRLDVGTR